MRAFTIICLACIIYPSFGQDSSSTYFKYPDQFQKQAFRFKPFMVARNALGGELELFSKKTASSIVIGSEIILYQEDDTEIFGGGIELNRRSYLNRSIKETNDSQYLFYMGYGVKFNYFKHDYTEFTYEEDPITFRTITTPVNNTQEFQTIALYIRAGIQILAFEKISIDMNIGAGVRYPFQDIVDSNYNDSFTFEAISRKGIIPTIHLGIGLAN